MSAGKDNAEASKDDKKETEFVPLDNEEIDALKKYASGKFLVFSLSQMVRSLHGFM